MVIICLQAQPAFTVRKSLFIEILNPQFNCNKIREKKQLLHRNPNQNTYAQTTVQKQQQRHTCQKNQFLRKYMTCRCNIFIRYRTLYSTSSKQPSDPTKVQKDSFGVRKEHNYLVNPGEQRNHQRGLARDLEGKLRDSGFSMIGGCNTDFPRDLLVQSLEMNQFLSKIRTKISGNPLNYKPPHKIFF